MLRRRLSASFSTRFRNPFLRSSLLDPIACSLAYSFPHSSPDTDRSSRLSSAYSGLSARQLGGHNKRRRLDASCCKEQRAKQVCATSQFSHAASYVRHHTRVGLFSNACLVLVPPISGPRKAPFGNLQAERDGDIKLNTATVSSLALHPTLTFSTCNLSWQPDAFVQERI